MTKCRECRKKPNGGAAVSAKQFSFECRNLAARPLHCEPRSCVVGLNLVTQLPEPIDHHSGVLAVECPGELRNAIRQCRANERPIRDALRAGRPHSPVYRP